MKEHYSIETLLLSLHRSLLGYVRPDLRAILVTNEDEKITITFILDHMPSLEDKDFYSESLLDFASDFPINTSIKIDENFIYSDVPSHKLGGKQDTVAYLRYEPPLVPGVL